MKTTPRKHPEEEAWNQYAESKKGIGIFRSSTLGNEEPDYFLKNRIQNSFSAGWRAAMEHIRDVILKS